MKTTFKFLSILAVIFATMAAQAQPDDSDYARVLSSRPVIQQVAVNSQDCQQRTIAAPAQQGNTGAAMVGGLFGAVLGNQVGGGQGKTIATVVGGIGGALLGNGVQNNQPQQLQTVTDCQNVTHYEPRTVGYDVVYEYAGRQRSTQMQREPGQQIRVRVTPLI